MSTVTTCRIADAFGNHLVEVANYSILDYTLNCTPGGIGLLELTLPPRFDTSKLFRDGRIGCHRSINNGPKYLDNGAIYLIKYIKESATEIFVRAYHANWILGTRIVAYNAGTAFTSKVATFADDQLKAIWAENAGASISAANRDGVETQADLSSYITIEANKSVAASVAFAGTRRNFAAVALDLCDASNTAGIYLTYEIIAPTESTLELRTYAVQRGIDHSGDSGQAFILSESRGNLENAYLVTDYSAEKTFIIAGGQGQQSLRLIAPATDTDRMGTSPFGRIEDFLDMSNTSDAATLQDQADAALRNGRPTILATGDLIETPKAIRGIHYDLGDILVVESPRTRVQYDVRLDVIHEHIDNSGHSQSQPLTAHQKTVKKTIGGLRTL